MTLSRGATVTSSRPASIDLAPDLASAMAARHFVADALARRGLDCLVDVAVLLVSELVTNAVRYAGGPVHLQIVVRRGRVRVEVIDEAPDGPRSASADTFAERGRGLLIVEALASRWSVEDLPPGKRVWFELDLVP